MDYHTNYGILLCGRILRLSLNAYYCTVGNVAYVVEVKTPMHVILKPLGYFSFWVSYCLYMKFCSRKSTPVTLCKQHNIMTMQCMS